MISTGKHTRRYAKVRSSGGLCNENLIGNPWRGSQSIVTPCHITTARADDRVLVSVRRAATRCRIHTDKSTNTEETRT